MAPNQAITLYVFDTFPNEIKTLQNQNKVVAYKTVIFWFWIPSHYAQGHIHKV